MKMNEACSLHDLAKILNNRAAYQITKTRYQEGINLLTKALNLAEQSKVLQREVDQIHCSCQFCSLESCLALEKDAQPQLQPSRSNDTTGTNKNESASLSSSEDLMDFDETHNDTLYSTNGCPQQAGRHCGQEKADYVDGFVYQRLILVNDRSIHGNHYMGSTLSFIILFNLALAHHLAGISNRNNNGSGKRSISYHQSALELYELAYQLHIDIIDEQRQLYDSNVADNNDDADVSLRLTMIISNNIGQIHRVIGNSEKFKMCLQHLLSLTMYAQQHQLLYKYSSSIDNSTVLDSIEFDGFMRNVSPILFTEMCASAA